MAPQASKTCGLLSPDHHYIGSCKSNGIDFKAIDNQPVHYFFMIVAPPLEVNNQYLPVLGKIAQFSKEPDVPERLFGLKEPAEFMALLEEKAL